MYQRSFVTLLALAIGWSPAFADSFIVTLKAVDVDKKPVTKADVALFWSARNGAMTPAAKKPLVTDADGKAVLRVEDWDERRAVLVLSADRALGGIAGVSKADDGRVLTVTLAPTARVKGNLACKELNFKPTWANSTVTVEGFRPHFMQNVSESAAFEFVLPAGKYTLASYGTDVLTTKQTITVTPDGSVHDLGTLDMKASAIAKLRGKVPPAWVVAAARGVKADVKLADYKGKWVLIEFWGHWCGPCCARSLPELIGLYEDYADHRDKFEILAVHSKDVKSFVELDKKLPPIKARYWQGKDLPFPVLLDSTGAIQKQYGVEAFPTHLLIDPDGKLVGEATAGDLEAKLPPLPLAKKWARHRDMHKNWFWSFVPSEDTPKKLADFIKKDTGCEVAVDAGALKACGLTVDEPLPGVLIGYGVTWRTIEQLLLAPHGLGVTPSADGKTLLITKRSPTNEAASYLQRLHAKEIADRLDCGPTAAENAKAKPLVINDQSLLDALKLMVREFGLPMALDAKAMHAGTLDPTKKVSGRLGPGELRQSMLRMLDPLGLTLEVRHEVVLLTPKKK